MAEKPATKRSKKETQIVETAEDLFMRYGVKRVTVEEICRRAGVSKMTFYKYFANKIELVRHLWNAWVDEGYERLDEIDEMDIPLPEKIQMMFDWKTDLLSKMSTEFLEEILPLDLEREKVLHRFMEFIIKAQKRGEIRAGINPEFLIAVLDKLQELGNNEELRARYPSLIEFNREIKDFFWYGVIVRGNSGRG
jgi:AcrR family transcriptional regulator